MTPARQDHPRTQRRRWAAVATVIFAALAPGTVLGLVPYHLAGRRLPEASVRTPSQAAGLALVAAGGPLVADSFVRFVKAAGTPAPTFETEVLVVDGMYRYVRNPQYVGVVTTLLGESLIYRSRRVLAYAAAAWLGFHVWVVVYEEPRLRRRFGDAYERYLDTTPRWVPRCRPAGG